MHLSYFLVEFCLSIFMLRNGYWKTKRLPRVFFFFEIVGKDSLYKLLSGLQTLDAFLLDKLFDNY